MKGSYTILTVFIFTLRINCLWSQFYSTGEAPASVRWNSIRTDHFTIVFPVGITREANNLANKLEYYKHLTEEDMQYTVKRFPVVLHSTSVLSNGYVTLAPRRMELVAVPPQDGYAQGWIDQLVLHEYRHAVHLSKLNQGFTRVLSWFTGEIAQGGISSLIPSWFYEGDAVYNETRLSASGRGRIPGFEMPLRAILLEHPRPYSYDKAIFGSYRNFVPDQYCYGYQLVSHARLRYGEEIWPRAIDYTARHPYFIWPLAFYLRKHTGFYKSGLYKQTMDSLKEKYIKQEDTITFIDYLTINRLPSKAYTNYLLPKDPGGGNIIALRTGMDDTGSFISIDSAGREKRLLITGYTRELDYDLHGSRLVWDEINTDRRWGRRDFSTLRTFDLRTGKVRSLTSGTRYFSPSFSPEGNSIAVVETDLANNNFITVVDAFTGNRVLRVPSPQNRILQFPYWLGDTAIIAVTAGEQGKQLELLDLRSNTWEVILPHTMNDISEPINYKKFILLRASFKGIENIYALRLHDPSSLYQVTFSRFGAYHPAISADSSMLLFSNYSHTGFQIVSVPLDTASWMRMANTWSVRASGAFQETGTLAAGADSLANLSYPSRPYRKMNRMFHFHSWLPFYAELEDYTGNQENIPINLGFMLFSQNLLSTVTSSIGYRYYQGNHEFIPVISWRGWYPVFELSAQLNGVTDKAHFTSYLPLTYSRGKYFSQVRPLLEYEYSGISYDVDDEPKTGIHYLHYQLHTSRYLRLSSRDIYPRLGQYITAGFTHTPFDQDVFGSMVFLQAGLFLPGIFPHHHIYFTGGIQRQEPEMYYLPLNRIPFPRGYSETVSGQISSLFVNYAFPAGYPDLSLGPLLYLKRFRIDLFHDWSYGRDIREYNGTEVVSYTGSLRSFGAEILADMHLIRIIFPITAGIRLGYLPGKEKFFSELIFSMDTRVF